MTRAIRSHIIRRLRRFAADQDGVSAVEFAMLLPLLITLYFGSIEITQAVTSDRKMTLVAGTVGDLVARASCVTDAEIGTIFNAAEAVLYPYNTAKMKIVVSSVIIDANKTATVNATAFPTNAWSQAYNGGSVRSGNVTGEIPEALRSVPGSLIWAEAYYDYTPTIGKFITGTKTLSEKVFLRPRVKDPVPKQNSCP
jgi:Flp pilus assembly protein TadG